MHAGAQPRLPAVREESAAESEGAVGVSVSAERAGAVPRRSRFEASHDKRRAFRARRLSPGRAAASLRA
ncbi:hypothetical protein [Lysobacter gummosus]|uniref:hypothetical protein n=1 Tax=Lysobacter gummosus TaxID=262324 RepID=UPI003638615B